MTETIEVPFWLLATIGLLALWVLLERLLLPSVRWFFRRRVNFLIDELNRRLKLRLPTFSLTKRRVLVDRLVYDPRVLAEVRRYCEQSGAPWDATLEQVERYAREIVPSFNAYFYFNLGRRFSRWLVQRLYRVRLSRADYRDLSNLPENASLVFVINHRSNMDYVLMAYLAQKQAALSYAVGEWARVWPLQQMVKAMGAYFVRRSSNNELYRRVLERYVQMAVDGGVVQAVFPEGGLSRDGAFREPKVGLLDYMLRDFDPQGERDIIFIPVCVNYDRVIEDRTLIQEAGRRVERKSAISAVWGSIKFLGRSMRRRYRGQWYRLGYAAAGFGRPVSARDWCERHALDFRRLPPRERIEQTRQFADALMGEIGHAMPVLPVSVVCWIMLQDPRRAWRREQLETSYSQLIEQLSEREVRPYIPRRDAAYAVEVALRMLCIRKLVGADEDGYRIQDGEESLLLYYANAIAHMAPEKISHDSTAA